MWIWGVKGQAGVSISVQKGRTTSRDTLNVIVFYQSRGVGDEILRQQQSSLRLEEGSVPGACTDLCI